MAEKKKTARKPVNRRTPEVWERQDTESAQAFEAFKTYRDMGADRSLVKVAQKLGKSVPLMERWSKDKEWVVRVTDWERDQDRQIRDILTKGKAAMLKNHTDIATAMLVKSVKALQKLPIEDMTPRDISTMVDIAAKLERISRGEVTDKTESKIEFAGELKVMNTNLDLILLSEDELNALDELVRKIPTA
jgi:hypothetical protein